MSEKIRSIVRKILQEYSVDSVRSVYPSTGRRGFPYHGATLTKLPQDIDPVAEYVSDWISISKNNDLYDFPTEEFNLGLKIEKQRNPKMTILDIADKVIKNLMDNNQFYTQAQQMAMTKNKSLNL